MDGYKEILEKYKYKDISEMTYAEYKELLR